MDWIKELFGDSEDEEFFGFRADEIPARRQDAAGDADSESESSSEESSEEDDNIQYKWAQRASPVDVLEFRLPFGPRNVPNNESARSFFKLSFTEDVIQNIVTETNRYAQQQNEHKPQKGPEWFDAEG